MTQFTSGDPIDPRRTNLPQETYFTPDDPFYPILPYAFLRPWSHRRLDNLLPRVSLAHIRESRDPANEDESPSGGPNATTNGLRQVIRRFPETASGWCSRKE